MTKPSGLMSLLPPIKDPVEDEEQAKAHAIVMQRINAASAALPAARIADQPLVSFTPEFYKNPEPKKTKKEIEDIKFKAHMEKEYGDEAIKRDVLKEIYQNKKAGREPYEGMSQSSIMVAEIVKDKAKATIKKQAAQTDNMMEQVIRNSPTPVKGYVGGATPVRVMQKNKKNLPINVDPDHPDGFTFQNDQDTYELYKDNPSRYIEEITYKYEGVPVSSAVKPYDSLDKSSFPSNPNQQAALRSYGKVFDRLTPLQKKQIANGQKKKAAKNPKLFENILPLK